MLIATFNENTGWAGKKITSEGEFFILEDHGPISAQDVMEYDKQGHLLWANDGTRAWVGSRAISGSDNGTASASTPATKQTTPAASPGGPPAARDAKRGRLSPSVMRVLLYCAIGAIAVAAIAVLASRRSDNPEGGQPGATAAPAPAPSATSQWVQVAAMSGSAGETIVESKSASSFELKGTNQRLDYTLMGNATADLPLGINVYVLDTTVNYEYGHVMNDAKAVASGGNSVVLHKQPGVYYLHVSGLRCTWQVALFEQR